MVVARRARVAGSVARAVHRSLLPIGTALAFALVGCGDDGAGDGDSPTAVAQTFFSAVSTGDFQTACDQLSPEGKENADLEADCPAEFARQVPEAQRERFADVNVRQITSDTEECDAPSDPDSAEVEATLGNETECVALSRIGGRWLIDDT